MMVPQLNTASYNYPITNAEGGIKLVQKTCLCSSRVSKANNPQNTKTFDIKFTGVFVSGIKIITKKF